MTKLTKVELVQSLAAVGGEVEALRVALAERTAQVELLTKQLEATKVCHDEACKALAQAEAARAAKPVRLAYQPKPPSPEQLALRAAMVAARELAMKTGRSVRVG